MHKILLDFVDYVVSAAALDSEDVNIIDYDLGRIYLAINSSQNNYNIRMWNANEEGILFSLYKNVGNTVEDIIPISYYKIPIES